MVDKFNMALLHLVRLNERLCDGDRAAQAGDYRGWYMSLELAYSMTRMECNPPERIDLDGLLNEVRNSVHSAYKNVRQQGYFFGVAHDRLVNFSNVLHEILDKHELIQPKMNVNGTMLEIVKKRYGDAKN